MQKSGKLKKRNPCLPLVFVLEKCTKWTSQSGSCHLLTKNFKIPEKNADLIYQSWLQRMTTVRGKACYFLRVSEHAQDGTILPIILE